MFQLSNDRYFEQIYATPYTISSNTLSTRICVRSQISFLLFCAYEKFENIGTHARSGILPTNLRPQ